MDRRVSSHPLTAAQRNQLITAYQATGNMAEAMRQAGIRSPRTAYLWWHRFQEAGAAGLQPRSHARKHQQTLAPDVVEAICRLRRANPTLGRRRLAQVVAVSYGAGVVSPSGAEAVLRRAGLWERATPPRPTRVPLVLPLWLRDPLDHEQLLEYIQTGFALSVQSEPQRAAEVLYGHVWQPLEHDPSRWSKLLRQPRLGAWLLRSRVQLGHSWMNSGNWTMAARYFVETLQWMSEHPPEGRQRIWEEEPQMVSLRRDDAWIECLQYLGIVLRNQDWKAAQAYTSTALAQIHRSWRPLVPNGPAMIRNLHRDFAKLLLRRAEASAEEIKGHLTKVQEEPEEDEAVGMRADAQIAWARLYSRQARRWGREDTSLRQQALARMEQALDTAGGLAEQESSPILRTILFTGIAVLAQVHGMPVQQRRIEEAAHYCLRYGYQHQAQEMQKLHNLHRLLPGELSVQLLALAQRG